MFDDFLTLRSLVVHPVIDRGAVPIVQEVHVERRRVPYVDGRRDTHCLKIRGFGPRTRHRDVDSHTHTGWDVVCVHLSPGSIRARIRFFPRFLVVFDTGTGIRNLLHDNTPARIRQPYVDLFLRSVTENAQLGSLDPRRLW